jgi:hypothetical protein
MKYYSTIIFAVLALVSFAHADLAGDVERAFGGKEVLGARIGDFGFDIKTVQITKIGSLIMAQGRLFHRSGGTVTDEQFDYTIVIPEPNGMAHIGYKVKGRDAWNMLVKQGKIVDTAAKPISKERAGVDGALDRILVMIAFKLEGKR